MPSVFALYSLPLLAFCALLVGRNFNGVGKLAERGERELGICDYNLAADNRYRTQVILLPTFRDHAAMSCTFYLFEKQKINISQLLQFTSLILLAVEALNTDKIIKTLLHANSIKSGYLIFNLKQVKSLRVAADRGGDRNWVRKY